MKDEELARLTQIALGNHDAFKTIFMKYFPKVKYFIAHIVKSESVAEELSQDIFLKIWERREKLPEIQSINSYLYRAAKNIAINHLERNILEERYIHNSKHTATQTNLEEEIDAHELEFLIELAVKRMPEQRRRIYTMSRVEDVKNKEIAKILDISEKTVNNQLSLALKDIRKYISIFLLFF